MVRHFTSTLTQLGLEMRSQYINMSCSFSTSMKSNCSFSSVLKTNSSFSTVLKTHTYFIPLTPPFGSIFGGGGRNVHYRFYRKRGFWPPPYRIDFAKNRKKSESTQKGLKRREIENFFFRFLAVSGHSESILIFFRFFVKSIR